MKVDVIVGGLYGDEGKGKVVSKLGNNYDYVFRVNASTNASHTVVLDNEKSFITKQLPSIFYNKDVNFVISPGAILNLHALKDELKNRDDLDCIYNHVTVASSISLLINPYIDRNKNQINSKKYGSTNQGTGNAVLARTSRSSVRLMDIENVVNEKISLEELSTKIEESCMQLDRYFYKDKSHDYYYKEAIELVSDYEEIKKMIGDFSKDYTKFLYELNDDKKILIEGCNGIMLDNLHGLNPYTTSASTSVNALLNGANISPYLLNDTYVIITGYFCCLNKRPFLTEMDLVSASKLYKYNSEVDDAENMKRRLGWFDLPTLKKALVGHKKSKLILNKLDIMQDLDEVKLCDYYLDNQNRKIEIMPDDVKALETLKPHYITFKGWKKLDGKKIPPELNKFINYIKENTNHEVAFIGVGRKKEDLINLMED